MTRRRSFPISIEGLAARIVGRDVPGRRPPTSWIPWTTTLQKALLSRVPAEERAELKTLLTFDPDTAGGVMNTEVVILDQDLSADQGPCPQIREEVEDKEVPYYAYLTDKKDRLVGRPCPLRDLLLARRALTLKDLIKDPEPDHRGLQRGQGRGGAPDRPLQPPGPARGGLRQSAARRGHGRRRHRHHPRRGVRGYAGHGWWPVRTRPRTPRGSIPCACACPG